MLTSLIEKARNHYLQQLPFVLYKKPEEAKINGIFQSDDVLHGVTDFSESGFVFAPFDDDDTVILIKVDEKLEEIIQPAHMQVTLDKVEVTNDGFAKEAFVDMVKKAKDAIHKSELEKVVVSRKKELPVSISAIDIFMKLVGTYGNAFCYLWHHPKIGTWLGATPEILIKSTGNSFTTMSLAGTQLANGADHVPTWGEKELEEQQLVTDYIESVLVGKVTKLEIGDKESVRAGRLWHLRTKITGNFKKGELGSLIRSLHPTPAVCGIPKDRSKKFIMEHESYDRLFYTGFLGELNLTKEFSRNSNPRNQENNAYRSVRTATELFVNLRCMMWEPGKAALFVGGGITAGSNPQKEWEETENKSQTLLKVLLD